MTRSMTAFTAPTTLLLQLSDLHIREPGRLAYGRLDTAPYLRQAVETVLRMPQRPEAIVATGDLTDFGRPEEYAHLRELLAPLDPIPLYLLPGNHDDRAQLRASFPGHAYLGTHGFVQFSVPVGGLQLIALDTVVPGASEGSLCAERLEWLAAQLDASRDRPVVIAMHHPPFRTLIGHMDEIGLLEGAQALEALVARHPNVERVICGHLHRSIQVRFGGTIAATVPSPAHQVCLDLAPDAASAWTLEPPGFAVHALPAGGRLVSHLAASGQYPGPYPFHDGGRLID
ncbi:phosphodiesterase [Paracidovorax oryzae]|uniref:phosphodiesterase n=1 Tax=Paracidovorax oryzae TaxID=862720 RepID=UPI0004793ACE|nr:phosphodiesterase [Paracidovorax oryzae]